MFCFRFNVKAFSNSKTFYILTSTETTKTFDFPWMERFDVYLGCIPTLAYLYLICTNVQKENVSPIDAKNAKNAYGTPYVFVNKMLLYK